MRAEIIKTKEDLRYYIAEDKKRNMGNVSFLKYIAMKLYNTDSYMSFNYLRALRKYEYAINCQKGTLVGNIIYAYRKIIWRRLSVKYGLVLPPNVIGYGFKMAHVVGGGVLLLTVNQ